MCVQCTVNRVCTVYTGKVPWRGHESQRGQVECVNSVKCTKCTVYRWSSSMTRPRKVAEPDRVRTLNSVQNVQCVYSLQCIESSVNSVQSVHCVEVP